MKRKPLANVIKNLRGKKTLRRFAEDCDVHNSLVSQIETGRVKDITLTTLGKFANGTGYSPEQSLKRISI